MWPSGAARNTNSAAMLPVAPGLFSTMTFWPQRAFSFSDSSRGSVSGTEPGPVGATIVTWRLGKVACADAVAGGDGCNGASASASAAPRSCAT